MANRQYIGARYVPKFATPVEWNEALSYEALTIVTHLGNSFTSKKPVPAGVDIGNAEYWVNTGNYNEQVESYRAETNALNNKYNELIEKYNRNHFNVLDYGAKGDGVTDDTAAFNACVAACPSGGTIFIPKGTYVISDTIAPKAYVSIIGENKHAVIKSTANPVIEYPRYYAAFSLFKNFAIIGTPNAIGIHLDANDQFIIDNISVSNCNEGAQLNGSGLAWVQNSTFEDNVTGVKVLGLIAGVPLQIHFYNDYFGNNKEYGLRVTTTVSGACGEVGSCYFFNNVKYDLEYIGTGGSVLSAIRVHDCFFGESAGAINVDGFTYPVNIEQNYIEQCTGDNTSYSIRVNSGTEANIRGNTFAYNNCPVLSLVPTDFIDNVVYNCKGGLTLYGDTAKNSKCIGNKIDKGVGVSFNFDGKIIIALNDFTGCEKAIDNLLSSTKPIVANNYEN